MLEFDASGAEIIGVLCPFEVMYNDIVVSTMYDRLCNNLFASKYILQYFDFRVEFESRQIPLKINTTVEQILNLRDLSPCNATAAVTLGLMKYLA